MKGRHFARRMASGYAGCHQIGAASRGEQTPRTRGCVNYQCRCGAGMVTALLQFPMGPRQGRCNACPAIVSLKRKLPRLKPSRRGGISALRIHADRTTARPSGCRIRRIVKPQQISRVHGRSISYRLPAFRPPVGRVRHAPTDLRGLRCPLGGRADFDGPQSRFLGGRTQPAGVSHERLRKPSKLFR